MVHQVDELIHRLRLRRRTLTKNNFFQVLILILHGFHNKATTGGLKTSSLPSLHLVSLEKFHHKSMLMYGDDDRIAPMEEKENN